MGEIFIYFIIITEYTSEMKEIYATRRKGKVVWVFRVGWVLIVDFFFFFVAQGKRA